MLLALLVDGVNISNWLQNGAKRNRKPQSIFRKLTEQEKPKDELMSFRTPEEYEEWMARKREKWNNA